MRSRTAGSGLSCSVTLSLIASRNIATVFILGTLELLLYQVLLCQRQIVMKSLRHLNVRKPLQRARRGAVSALVTVCGMLTAAFCGPVARIHRRLTAV
jgi:hypothetical protein